MTWTVELFMISNSNSCDLFRRKNMSKLTKKLSIGIIFLSLCGFNEYVYAMEESIDKNEMRVWE